MRTSLLAFLKVLIAFSFTCAATSVVGMWLIPHEEVSYEVYINAGVIGAIGGAWIGTGVWLLFYRQVRKHNLKK